MSKFSTPYYQSRPQSRVLLALFPDEPLCNCGDCLLKDCRTYSCGGAQVITLRKHAQYIEQHLPPSPEP